MNTEVSVLRVRRMQQITNRLDKRGMSEYAQRFALTHRHCLHTLNAFEMKRQERSRHIKKMF